MLQDRTIIKVGLPKIEYLKLKAEAEQRTTTMSELARRIICMWLEQNADNGR